MQITAWKRVSNVSVAERRQACLGAHLETQRRKKMHPACDRTDPKLDAYTILPNGLFLVFVHPAMQDRGEDQTDQP